jgi:hypothetical protein
MNKQQQQTEVAANYLEDINRDIAMQLERTEQQLNELAKIQQTLTEENKKLDKTNKE